MRTYLIEVNGSRMILVDGAADEKQARREAYESVFGEPTDDEERATDATVEEYTTVRDVHHILLN